MDGEKSSAPRKSGRGKGVLKWVILLAVLGGVFFFVIGPPICRAKKSADLTSATCSLRNLGIFLFAFEDEWGTFPSEKILRANPDRFPGVRKGRSSNALLSMLIAGGYTTSEEVFQAPNFADWCQSPDNKFATPDKMLERGECGMAYVMMQGRRAMTTKHNGGRPLLVTPLQHGSGGSDPRFNPEPYNGRSVYMRIDQSVKQNQIDDDGRILLPGNLTLFEGGPDTVWGEDVPEVVAPE